MIKYRLKCDQGHDFDSWFGSIDDYERLTAQNLVNCAICGGTNVERALMAPSVSSDSGAGALTAPTSAAEQAVRELRKNIEANSDDVGKDFAAEARRISDGDAPERAIRGQASLVEAKGLVDDGIPVVPLPWNDRRKN